MPGRCRQTVGIWLQTLPRSEKAYLQRQTPEVHDFSLEHLLWFRAKVHKRRDMHVLALRLRCPLPGSFGNFARGSAITYVLTGTPRSRSQALLVRLDLEALRRHSPSAGTAVYDRCFGRSCHVLIGIVISVPLWCTWLCTLTSRAALVLKSGTGLFQLALLPAGRFGTTGG